MTNAHEVPPSLRERLLSELCREPRWHTARSLHQALFHAGWDTLSLQAVYNELGRMTRKGELVRTQRPGLANSRTHYTLAPGMLSPLDDN